MKQILLIHGGDSFSSYDAYITSLKNMAIDYERLKPKQKWKTWLIDQLPGCDVLLPTLPNGFNAVYDEWVIYFEKLLPYFGNDIRLVGHSLGAMFLAKYLHTHILPQKVRQLILIAGQYGTPENDDVGSFVVESATGLDNSAEEIHLFYSADDPVIDFASVHKFKRDIPSAVSHEFTDRGHFLAPEFPELLEILKQK